MFTNIRSYVYNEHMFVGRNGGILIMFSQQHPILNMTVQEIGELSVDKLEDYRIELINWITKYRENKSTDLTNYVFRYFMGQKNKMYH